MRCLPDFNPYLDAVLLDLLQDARLQPLDLLLGQAVCLRDDRHNIHFGVQLLHELNVQRLHAVAERRDKVEAAVNAIVHNVASIQAALVAQESLVLLVDVFQNRAETIRIVNGVAEAGRVDDGEP